MQALESKEDNKGEIQSHIRLALSRVSCELNKLNFSTELDLANLVGIYKDSLKLLINFPEIMVDDDLLDPLTKVVQSVDDGNPHKPELICLLGLLLLQNLYNESSFNTALAFISLPQFALLVPKAINVLEQGRKNDDNVLVSFNMMDSWVDMLGNQSFKDTVYQYSLNTFKFFLNHLKNIMEPIVLLNDCIQVDNTLDSNWYQISSSLDALVKNLMTTKHLEFSLVCVLNMKLMEKLNWLWKKDINYTTTVSCKIIKFLVVEVLSGHNFPTKILSNPFLSTGFKSNELQLATFELSNRNLEFALKHLLHVLDGTDSLSEQMIQIYTNWAQHQVINYCQLQYGKLNIYTIFNKFKPNISLFYVFQLLNFHLLNETFAYTKIQAAHEKLQSILKQSRLPPYPKPSYWSDEFVNDKVVEFKLTDYDFSVDVLSLNLIKSLKLMSMFTQEELMSTLHTQDCDLQKRIVINKLETLLANIMLSQYVFTHIKTIPKLYRILAKYHISRIVIELLNTDLDSNNLNQKFTWILFLTSMMNYVTTDLKHLHGVNYLINTILVEFSDSPIINDPAIRTIICDFVNQYNDEELRKYPELCAFTGYQMPSSTGVVTIPAKYVKAIQGDTYQDLPDSANDSVSPYFTGSNLDKKASLSATSHPNSNPTSQVISKQESYPTTTNSFSTSHTYFQDQNPPQYQPKSQYQNQYQTSPFQNKSQSSYNNYLDTSAHESLVFPDHSPSLVSTASDYNPRQQRIHVDEFNK